MRPWTSVLFVIFTSVQAYAADLLVSPQWLAKHRGEVRIVHVAAVAESYTSGHVPGAVYLPLSKLAVKTTSPNELPPVADLDATIESLGIGDADRVVVYGDEPIFASRLFFTFDYLGHRDQVALLDGGLDAWKKAGLPTEKDSVKPERASFTPHVDASRLVTHAQMRELVAKGGRTVIDARPPAQFRGEQSGDGVTRPGHIPGATSLYWQDALNPDGTVKSRAELRALFGDTTRPVTYCRTGMQSSFDYFLLRLLGEDPAMYDGSFYEWSGDAEAPVER